MIILNCTKAELNYVGYLMPAFKHQDVRILATNSIHELLAAVLSCPSPPDIISTNPSIFYSITGNKKDKSEDGGISAYAGSIYPFPNSFSKILFISPVRHYFISNKERWIMESHINKIINPDQYLPAQEILWKVYTPSDATHLNELLLSAILISADIETEEEFLSITLAGFTFLTPHSTFTYVIEFSSLENIRVAREILASPIAKVMHNGKYDTSYFIRFGCPPVNYIYDTQYLQHSYYSESPKTLGFVSGLYNLEHQYWKSDRKTERQNWHQFCYYNARDCFYTLKAFLNMVLFHMPPWGWKNYLIKFPELYTCIDVNFYGLPVDLETREKAIKSGDELEEKYLNSVRTQVRNTNYNPLSSKQNATLFELFGASVYRIKGTDKIAASKLKLTHPLTDRVLTAVENYKKIRKINSTYYKAKLLGDRLLFSLDPFATETGRSACRQSEFWCGAQIQNFPEAARVIIKAPDGWIFGSSDMPQSESRCTAYISGDKNLITAVESPLDFHKVNASKFFGMPYEEVSRAVRTIGKRVNHGANYNMGWFVLLETMTAPVVWEAARLLDLPPSWGLKTICEFLLDVFDKTYPDIRGVYYERVKQIARTGKLFVNELGWTRKTFLDPTKNKHDLNALVAHGPQNLSVAIINKGFTRIYYNLHIPHRDDFRVLMQIHDELVFMVKDTEEHRKYYGDKVIEYMTFPIPVTDARGITRTMLIPPGNVVWGKTWDSLKG